MKICRFKNKADEVRIGLVADDATLLDLTPAGITQMFPLLESENAVRNWISSPDKVCRASRWRKSGCSRRSNGRKSGRRA